MTDALAGEGGSRGEVASSRRTHDSSGLPLVSIVIACYNQGHLLHEAIDSARSQTYSPVEIIVVDDGSTDITPSVVSRYPDITYLRQANRGLAAARNSGLMRSAGEMLVFLDSDDRLIPNAVAVGVDQLSKDPACAFVAGYFRNIDADGRPLPDTPRIEVERDHYLALLRSNFIRMHAAVMYRREPLLAAGGFDASLRLCEDYDMYLRLAQQKPVRCHDERVAEYRRHSGGSSRRSGEMLRTAKAVLRSHRPARSASRHVREAYRSGVRGWEDHYGRLLYSNSRQSWRDGKRVEALSTAATTARLAPRILIREMVSPMRQLIHQIGRKMPSPVQRFAARVQRKTFVPEVRATQFGDLRRLKPISNRFGFDRGLPVDRYYIERFLAENAEVVRGRVLEVGDDSYTRKFGGAQVLERDVLHVSEGNPAATFVGDLTAADHIPSDAFDCVILTQTLQLVYDVPAAIAHLYRILKPGGSLLATVPGISQRSHDEWADVWYWSFTSLSARAVAEEVFPPPNVEVQAHGNVLTATAFLQGLAAEELEKDELNFHDPQYQMLITIKAQKPKGAGATS